MSWSNFEIFGYIAISIWVIGFIISMIKPGSKILLLSGFSGTVVIGASIVVLWNYLERPPMRTLAETRLWYAFFLSLIGNIIYLKWKYSWFFIFSILLAILFIVINILNPETYNKSLMPALQSVWFIPHVVVYMIAYAFLASSFIISLNGLVNKKTDTLLTIQLADNVVNIGFGFLTMGLLFGALWAKKAWGHYWTWDPKETWAFITWVAYLIYIHNRSLSKKASKNQLFILFFAFILLLVCWFGVQYLPSAVNSVHNYAY
ncbi:MAG: cytochrome C assembly protein [Bacteroidetes bacterium]|nr:MAG: cytochrome C assembly protein [Bacteroidota bacterium]